MNRWLIRLFGVVLHIGVALVWGTTAAIGLFGIGGFLIVLAPSGTSGGWRDGQPPIG